MTKIKNFIMFSFTIIVIGLIYINFDDIKNSFVEYFDEYFKATPTLIIKDGNKYTKSYDFNYVSNSKDYIPHNYDDLVNIYYSVFNQGWDEFTFYCPEDYSECIDDVKLISNDKLLLSNINNFVSPFNSYSEIKTLYDSTGEITIETSHLYNEYERQKLSNDIKDIIDNNTNDYMSDKEKIKTIHDYIINNTKYDKIKADSKDNTSPYDSSRINGVLYDHYAICSGYSDTMAAALDIMGFKNFKISSDTHVWNAVYIDNNWYHLDLTWDDPITVGDENKNTLSHEYFLVDNARLFADTENVSDHFFDEKIYTEMN